MLFRHAPVVAVMLLAVISLAENASTAPATTATPTTQRISPSQVQRWFDDLAASDAAVRENAFAQLLALRRQDLPALRAVVEKSRPLAPSQAGVLHDVVTHVYLTDEGYERNPKSGFLGLLFPVLDSVEVQAAEGGDGEEVASRTGVPIEYRLPGFCGFRALREGDIVLGIVSPNPRRLGDWRELSLFVRTLPAGQTVTFEVLRQGRLLKVPIRLDARPLKADERVWQDEVLPVREAVAEEYWSQNFLPLLDQRVNGTS